MATTVKISVPEKGKNRKIYEFKSTYDVASNSRRFTRTDDDSTWYLADSYDFDGSITLYKQVGFVREGAIDMGSPFQVRMSGMERERMKDVEILFAVKPIEANIPIGEVISASTS